MYNKIINKIFQNAWFFGLKALIPRKNGPGLLLSDYAKRMVWQIRLAKLFQAIFRVRVGFIFFGDSNEELFAQFRFMRRWPCLAINIAVGGTRADSWIQLFGTDVGKAIYADLRKFIDAGAKTLMNVGGNNVLQRMMKFLENALLGLKSMFPESFACTTPPIRFSMILDKELNEAVKTDVATCNSLIAKIWGARTIDLYTPFRDPTTGEAYPWMTRDMVHWSDIAEKVILNEEKRIMAA